MTDLCPLALPATAAVSWESGALAAREIGGLAAIHLKTRLHAQQLIDALALPAIGAVTNGDGQDTIGLGPGEWLFLIETVFATDLMDRVLAAAAGRGAAIWAQDRDIVVEIDAEPALLSQLTGITEAAFAPDRAVRTRLADMPVIVLGRSSTRSWLIFERSRAPHLRAWLDAAV